MTNEHALLAQWINRHDEEAFHGIVRSYSGLVYAACLRVLRNEADAQEAALDAFLALSQLRRVPDSPLGAWLHRTAVHRAIDRYRKTQTRNHYESAHAREAAPEAAPTGWDDVSGLVDEAVADLPEELRQAVVGHFFEGKTHAELAETAGLSRQAITKRVHQGVEEVRESLIKKGVPVAGVAALTLLLEEHAVAAPAVPAALAASLGKIAVSGFSAAGAAMGAAGTSLGLAAKALIAAVVLAVMAGVGYGFLPGIAKRNMVLLKSVPMAMAKNEYRRMFPKPPAKTRAGSTAAKSAAAGAVAPNEEPAPEGGVTVRGTLEGMFGGMVGEADVVLEKITWAPNEMPPSQTEKRCGKADSEGNIVVEHVPDGDWSIAAWGDLGSGGGTLHIENGVVPPPGGKELVFPWAPCSGVVADETGAPVPNAILYVAGHELLPDTEVSHAEGAANRAQTDAEGRFRFDRMVEGGVKYFVAIPGGIPRYTDYVKTGEDVRIQLPPTGRIRGRVVAEKGEGVPGEVALRFLNGWYRHFGIQNGERTMLSDGRIEQTILTDRNGNFLSETVPGAKYRLQLPEKSDWVLSKYTEVEVQPGKELSATIRVERAKTLYGKVVDAQTGEPLGAGIEVLTYLAAGICSSVTDAEGNYRLHGLSKGRHALELRGPLGMTNEGRYPYSATSVMPEWTADVQDAETRFDPRVHRFRLHGIVTNSSGAPMSGVEVKANIILLAKTDDAGRFDTRCVYTGDALRLEAEKDGQRGLLMVEVTPGGDVEANLRLSRASTGTISGVVVLQGGASTAGMNLHAAACLNCAETNGDYRTTLHEGKETTVGNNGEFSLSGLVPGEYRFSLSQGGGNFSFVNSDILVLKPGEQRNNVQLRFEEPQARVVAGVVMNEEGQPIPQCQVLHGTRGEVVLAGADGHFEFSEKSPDRSTWITFYAKGYTQVAGQWENNKTDHRITLKKLRHLYGRVVDANGTPIGTYKMDLRQVMSLQTAPEPITATLTVSDAAGVFDFPSVFAPPTEITVTTEGYGTYSKYYDAETDYSSPLEIVLHPAVLVEGTVVDTSNAPLSGYLVQCGRETVTTDASGRFSSASCGSDTECGITVRRTGSGDMLWVGRVTAPANVVCRIGQTGNLLVNVAVDGVPFTDLDALGTEFTAVAEWQTENGVQASITYDVNRRKGMLGTWPLPAGPVQVRVHAVALEQFGPAVCEKVVEAQVVAEQETTVQVNFETPGVTAAAPVADDAPPKPGVTEE